mmetsp:Transcript_9912/g.14608  ORF Transcript_9912/g.14608 Transcript_9912/m.14608 type:complete len:121 (-) Transcript_9912:112-474(-)
MEDKCYKIENVQEVSDCLKKQAEFRKSFNLNEYLNDNNMNRMKKEKKERGFEVENNPDKFFNKLSLITVEIPKNKEESDEVLTPAGTFMRLSETVFLVQNQKMHKKGNEKLQTPAGETDV